MTRTRPREVYSLAEDHTAGQRQSCTLSPGRPRFPGLCFTISPLSGRGRVILVSKTCIGERFTHSRHFQVSPELYHFPTSGHDPLGVNREFSQQTLEHVARLPTAHLGFYSAASPLGPPVPNIGHREPKPVSLLSNDCLL